MKKFIEKQMNTREYPCNSTWSFCSAYFLPKFNKLLRDCFKE